MLYTSPNSVMSHLVNTEQSQEFLCRALAVLLVSIQNSSWNDEFMFICLLKKGKISIGELRLSIYLCKCFTYSILPIQVLLQPCEVGWAFSPNCSWEHKAGQRSQGWTLPRSWDVKSWSCFTLKDCAAFPTLAGSTASQFCSQTPGFQFWFLSFT